MSASSRWRVRATKHTGEVEHVTFYAAPEVARKIALYLLELSDFFENDICELSYLSGGKYEPLR